MLLHEEMRIKDARNARVESQKRPHYLPTECLAILELKAKCGWTKAETARRFQVTDVTIADWMRRVDEGGRNALIQTSEPVNKFPDAVCHIVQKLKVLCPNLGKKKIAQMLGRAGLHLAVSTVGKKIKEELPPAPEYDPESEHKHEHEDNYESQSDKNEEKEDIQPERKIIGKYPGHTWHPRLDYRPNRQRLLGPMASFRLFPNMAILLLGRSCRRSFIATLHGNDLLQETSHEESAIRILTFRLCRSWKSAQIYYLRQDDPGILEGGQQVQEVV